MAAKAKMGWDMGRDMSHSPVRIGLGYGGGYGPRGCNRRFCDGGPDAEMRSRIIHDGGTARRHSPLLDSLDSLPDMIRLKRDFCGAWRVRHGANYRSSRNVRAISLEIASLLHVRSTGILRHSFPSIAAPPPTGSSCSLLISCCGVLKDPWPIPTFTQFLLRLLCKKIRVEHRPM